MKLRMIDRVSACDPWKSIQGQKMWISDECLTNNSLQKEKEPPLLSASLVLDAFRQLAMWLIVYSSEFQQTGLLHQVDRFHLMRWQETSDWLYVTLDVTSQKNHSILFEGHALTGSQLVAWVGGLELSILPISNPENIEEFETLWKAIQTRRPLDKSL